MSFKKTANPSYFFLARFGNTTSQFYLLSVSPSYSCQVFGPVEVLSAVFSNDPQLYFISIIKKLEDLSARKVLHRDLLVVNESDHAGVKWVSLIDGGNWTEKIEMLKPFKKLGVNEAGNQLLNILGTVLPSFNILNLGMSYLSYGKFSSNASVYHLIDKQKTSQILLGLTENNNATQVMKWLPFEISVDELENFIANKNLYPQAISLTLREVEIEHALLRELIKTSVEVDFLLKEDLRRLILTGNILRRSSTIEQYILTCIDGLELTGVTYIYFDRDGIVDLMAPLLEKFEEIEIRKRVISSVIEHNVSCITIQGGLRNDELIGKVDINQGFDASQEVNLHSGTIYHLPFQGSTTLKFTLKRDCYVFASQLNRKQNKSSQYSFELKVEGGTKGLIIDTRGRPIKLSEGMAGRDSLAKWNQNMNVYHRVMEI